MTTTKDIFADALASSGNIEQGSFLNRFATTLRKCCKDHSSHEMQICYIADELTEDADSFVTALAEFVRLKKEESPIAKQKLSDLRTETYRVEEELREKRKELEEVKEALEEAKRL